MDPHEPSRRSSAPDLGSYLSELEARRPGSVLRIGAPLSVRHEVTALQVGLDRAGRCPVLVVERPILGSGEESEVPVVTNLAASRSLCAAVLGASDHRRAAAELAGRMAHPIPPERVEREVAPSASVELGEEELDLRRIPALVQHDLDPGPYLSAAHVSTWDPDSGVDNTAIQRAWVHGERELRFYPYPGSHNMTNITKWWGSGEDAPVALWIGHHPAVDIGSNQKIGYPESHWGRAGALAGVPVRLMPTRLWGDRLLVPADCELVLEGVVLRDTWRAEGPFGEYTGYLGPQRPSPVIEVRAMSGRAAPLYHDYGSGLPDMLVPDNLLLESAVFELVSQVAPSLRAVHVPTSGRRFHCYLQLERAADGEARAALEAAIGHRRIKHAVVVDEDVDVFDERQVLWAVATRVQWTRDVIVRSGMDTSPADPSLPAGRRVSDKAGLDATLPAARRRDEPRPAAAVSAPGRGADPGELLGRLVGGRLAQLIAE